MIFTNPLSAGVNLYCDMSHRLWDKLKSPLPEPVLHIPWGHNVILIEKVKESAERVWYARQTIEHGWSRAILH